MLITKMYKPMSSVIGLSFATLMKKFPLHIIFTNVWQNLKVPFPSRLRNKFPNPVYVELVL